MSHENVEIVKVNFDLWNAGDMDTWRELFDPDGIMRNPEGWPEPGPQVGRDAVMHFVHQLRDGKLWRVRTYAEPREALEAVGLSEQDAHADS